jgi:hypothetical protein
MCVFYFRAHERLHRSRKKGYISISIILKAHVEHCFEPGGPSGPGPRSGQSAPVGRTVRACAEQFRVPSFVIWLFARFAELARNPVV